MPDCYESLLDTGIYNFFQIMLKLNVVKKKGKRNELILNNAHLLSEVRRPPTYGGMKPSTTH